MTTMNRAAAWIASFLLEFFQPGEALMILSAAQQKIEGRSNL